MKIRNNIDNRLSRSEIIQREGQRQRKHDEKLVSIARRFHVKVAAR